MITHIVLLKTRADDAIVAATFDEIGALQGSLDGLRSVLRGRSTSPERIERGFLHGLVLTFDDWAALEGYQADPRHVATSAKIRDLAEPDGVLVFDLES